MEEDATETCLSTEETMEILKERDKNPYNCYCIKEEKKI